MNCFHCDGRGRLPKQRYQPGGEYMGSYTCSACNGTGRAEEGFANRLARAVMGEEQTAMLFRHVRKAIPCAICREPYPRMLKIADVIFCKSCIVRALLDMDWITDEQAQNILSGCLEEGQARE